MPSGHRRRREQCVTQEMGNDMQVFKIHHNILHGLFKSSKWYFQTNDTKSYTFPVHKGLQNPIFMCFPYIMSLNVVNMQHTKALKILLTSKAGSYSLAHIGFSGFRALMVEAHNIVRRKMFLKL